MVPGRQVCGAREEASDPPLGFSLFSFPAEGRSPLIGPLFSLPFAGRRTFVFPRFFSLVGLLPRSRTIRTMSLFSCRVVEARPFRGSCRHLPRFLLLLFLLNGGGPPPVGPRAVSFSRFRTEVAFSGVGVLFHPFGRAFLSSFLASLPPAAGSSLARWAAAFPLPYRPFSG